MRNALVHDYLTIDGELLQQILAEQQYLFLTDFIATTSGQLRS